MDKFLLLKIFRFRLDLDLRFLIKKFSTKKIYNWI
jgi:hypothetical protein